MAYRSENGCNCEGKDDISNAILLFHETILRHVSEHNYLISIFVHDNKNKSFFGGLGEIKQQLRRGEEREHREESNWVE